MLSWGNETVLNPLSFAKWYHLGPFWPWSEGDIIRNNKKKGQKDEMLLALKMEKGGGGVVSQGMQTASKSWKGQGNRFAIVPSENNSDLQHLGGSLVIIWSVSYKTVR